TIQQSLGRIAPRDCGCLSSPWNLRFRLEEQLNLDFELGTGHKRAGYPSNPLMPGASGALKMPTAIDLGKLVALRSSRSNQKFSGRSVMPSRNESAHARARLQLETPVSDETLLKLQEQVA